MNDHFKAYVQFKALSHRFSSPLPGGGHTIDHILDAFESEALKSKNGKRVDDLVINESLSLQNVCAKLSVPLVRRMEADIEVLSMSKREFIELAVISALDECERIMAENEVSIPEYPSQDGEVELE